MLRQRKGSALNSTANVSIEMPISFTTMRRRRRGKPPRVNAYFGYTTAFIFLSIWFVVPFYFKNSNQTEGVSIHIPKSVELSIDKHSQTNRLRRRQSSSNISKIEKSIKCLDGSQGIINDDFCDCPDGSDEPRTSACSHLILHKTFDCGDGLFFIFSSRVRDGVKDCPDGSDERT